MRRSGWLSILLGASLLVGSTALAQTPGAGPGLNAKTFEKSIAKTLACRYALFLPAEYGKVKKDWPLLLFLHGAGERGDDLNQVKKHGPLKIAENDEDFPFIVLAPQCPRRQWWDVELLAHLLDEIIDYYDVDEKRVYLTGLSMGGFGAYELAAYRPDRFAAMAPICGGGTLLQTWRLRNIPAWVFHGAKDGTVPVEESKRMVDILKRARGEVKLTIYPEAEHDSWTQTYENPELYAWFLEHEKQ